MPTQQRRKKKLYKKIEFNSWKTFGEQTYFRLNKSTSHEYCKVSHWVRLFFILRFFCTSCLQLPLRQTFAKDLYMHANITKHTPKMCLQFSEFRLSAFRSFFLLSEFNTISLSLSIFDESVYIAFNAVEKQLFHFVKWLSFVPLQPCLRSKFFCFSSNQFSFWFFIKQSTKWA